MNKQEDLGEQQQRAEAAMLVRAWAEGPRPSDVRALVTTVESDERRTAGSLEAMHLLIDEILVDANVISADQSDGEY